MKGEKMRRISGHNDKPSRFIECFPSDTPMGLDNDLRQAFTAVRDALASAIHICACIDMEDRCPDDSEIPWLRGEINQLANVLVPEAFDAFAKVDHRLHAGQPVSYFDYHGDCWHSLAKDMSRSICQQLFTLGGGDTSLSPWERLREVVNQLPDVDGKFLVEHLRHEVKAAQDPSRVDPNGSKDRQPDSSADPRTAMPPDGEWLMATSMADIANRLGNVGRKKAKSMLKNYGLRNAGNRQLWTCRLDLLPTNIREKLVEGRQTAAK